MQNFTAKIEEIIDYCKFLGDKTNYKGRFLTEDDHFMTKYPNNLYLYASVEGIDCKKSFTSTFVNRC